MNFAFSGQKRFGLSPGVMGSRQFGTNCKFDIIPKANKFINDAVINPAKSFTNPNFVNKNHPKLFSLASIFRIGRSHSPEHDDEAQPKPEPKSSPTCKKYKKSRKRNKKSKRNHTKKPPKRTDKPWHKTKDDEMDLIADFDMTNDKPYSTQSSPIDIDAVSISPCHHVLKCLSVSSDNSSTMSPSPSLKRLRIPSECDSEDSFIIFTEECDADESDDDSDVTDETDDEDDDDDDDIEFDVNFKGCDITNKNKKVTFKCDAELCEVHPMSEWEDDYQLARVGPWEQYARDRARFESRIKITEETLSPILNQKHRERIYASRFQEHE